MTRLGQQHQPQSDKETVMSIQQKNKPEKVASKKVFVHTVTGIVALFCLCIETSAFAQTETNATTATQAPEQKVLFLTNSTFHSHGGCMEPFDGYCDDAGVHFDASGSYAYFESTPRGKRISPFIKGQIEDQRILDLLDKELFDYVVLVTRFGVFRTDDGAREETEAFKKMHEYIVRSGARTVVSISYLTRGSTNNADRQKRILAKHEDVKDALDNMVIDGKKHPIILAPTGLLWAEGVKKFGMDAWFADAVHGTPLAQHSSGCLFFTFITGVDPRKNGYLDLYVEDRFPDKELTPEQSVWLRKRVWSLYRKHR